MTISLSKFLWLPLIVLFLSCASKKQLDTNEKIALKKELQEMVDADQIAANIPKGDYKLLTTEEWQTFKDSVFTANKQRLEVLYKQYGFLGFDKVDQEGAIHFWLLVQHCDEFPDFQKRILKDMEKEVSRGNANAKNFAYLYDRVQTNAQKKQKFGTQVDYEVATTGRAFPKYGLIDSANVDALRSQYDLSTLKEYLNMMTTMHFEMNKAQYEKKGMHAPNLYE